MVTPQEPLLKTGAQFAGYRILAPLSVDAGTGIHAFSARRASELRLDALRVLYCMRSEGEPPEDEIARFKERALRLQALQLPELPLVDDSGFSAGLFWVAVEDVRGSSLKELILKRDIDTPWPLAACLRLVASVARVMKTAADQGIVHLGINPRRIYSTPDLELTKITGLGILQLFDKVASFSRVEDLPYIAPEQIVRDWSGDAKSDVYSLGMSFFEVCTLEVPFADNHGVLPGELMIHAILKTTPEPIRRSRPNAPESIEGFLHRLVGKRPASRISWESVIVEASALAEEYERWTKRAAEEKVDSEDDEPAGGGREEAEGHAKGDPGPAEGLTADAPDARRQTKAPPPPPPFPPRARALPAVAIAVLGGLGGVLLTTPSSDRVSVAPQVLSARPAPPVSRRGAPDPPSWATCDPLMPTSFGPPAAPAEERHGAVVRPPASAPPAPRRARDSGSLPGAPGAPGAPSAPSAGASSPAFAPPIEAVRALYSFQSRRKQNGPDED
jgi:hypothetical protein